MPVTRLGYLRVRHQGNNVDKLCVFSCPLQADSSGKYSYSHGMERNTIMGREPRLSTEYIGTTKYQGHWSPMELWIRQFINVLYTSDASK